MLGSMIPRVVADLVKSKKAIAAMATVLVAIGGKIGWDVSTEELMPILTPLVAYIVGQGIADNGKERAKVEAAQCKSAT